MAKRKYRSKMKRLKDDKRSRLRSQLFKEKKEKESEKRRIAKEYFEAVSESLKNQKVEQENKVLERKKNKEQFETYNGGKLFIYFFRFYVFFTMRFSGQFCGFFQLFILVIT